MQLNFYKYQGTGNDFILLDNRKKQISLSTQQIKFMCHRRFGIGADGLMLLELEPGFDFKMVYFNSDGNQSSMCGNGGRCITAFANKLGLIKDKYSFIAIDGAHEAIILENKNVSLKMQDVNNIEIGIENYYLNTGSPHFVKQVSGLNDFNVKEEGYNVRNNARFKSQGTNVNFIEKQNNALFVRTYERGVEDETLSCGTGVTAAALVAAITGISNSKNNCLIKTLGGELEVKFERDDKNNFNNIRLVGPAEFVFSGTITI